jgi:hypothetical protein
MRSDLGRLDAVAEILQIGQPLRRKARVTCELGLAAGDAIVPANRTECPMRVLAAAAFIALLTMPAYAQMPKVNLLSDMPTKTQEQKDAEDARDKAYKESLKKIPDAKTPADPWGNVRTDAPKASASAKPRTKTGSNANAN